VLTYIYRRLVYMIPTLIVISIISFIIIQLPPGDYLTTMINAMVAEGQEVDMQTIQALERQYGLNRPMYVQYWYWITGIVTRGDFGFSFQWDMPVWTVIRERLALTMAVSMASLFFSWMVALPIGIYSAVKQYSIGDYIFTVIGFLGLATPNFLLALMVMFFANRYFGTSVGGLFSSEYQGAAWSLGKVIDLLRHIWIPMVIVGTAGAASMLRITRANLLDELRKPYVDTGRAKGMRKWHLIIKYPVRIALNPFISSIAFVFPQLVSGAVITSVVLNLPTTGPLMLNALLSQDMYLAGSFVLLLATMTVFGVLISDLLLAWLDPRIRYD